MAGSRRVNGFTLIEMLIAMTLLGIMVVLLFASLKIAADSWNAGEEKIVEVNKKAVVYQFFKRHLSTIRPLIAQLTSDIDDGSLLQPVFQGQQMSLRFVAALPLSAARKGLQIFEIAQDTNRPSTIMVGLSPYQQGGGGQTERVVLLEHVKSIGFAYLNMQEGGQAVWLDNWPDPNSLPKLIKVAIRLDDDSYWPTMVFPVKITGQALTAGNANAGN